VLGACNLELSDSPACACSTMVCYNKPAFDESRSGGRRSRLRGAGGGKSEHHRAASQLTAGRARTQSRLTSGPSARMTTSATENRPASGLSLRGGLRVMGETVGVRAHQRAWRHCAARQTPRGARPNREASHRAARPKTRRLRLARYDLRVGRSTRLATAGLDE
jgi:hypothetical protein